MRKFYRDPNEVNYDPNEYYNLSYLKLWKPSKYRLNRVVGFEHDLWRDNLLDVIEIHNADVEMADIDAAERVYGYLKRAVVFK